MGDMWILFTILWRVFTRLLRYLRRGIFLVPVAAMGMALFGLHPWTIAMVVLAVFVAFWRPVIAAALLPVTMVVAGVSGLVVAATEPGSRPSGGCPPSAGSGGARSAQGPRRAGPPIAERS